MSEVSSVFRSGKSIVPCSFRKIDTLPAHQIVTRSFAKTIALHNNNILGARGKLKKPKPKRVAVMFSGGPASGGHNVLVGLSHVLKNSQLFGVFGGPAGLLQGNIKPIGNINHLKGTGGFDYLGTDRTKIKTVAQLMRVRMQCEKHRLDALIVIGGDDSNTNAALLAEYLAGRVQVIGVPKTIDGDVQVKPWLPITFGFHTATETYATLVKNLMKDAASSGKYWHFVRLMGRDASHVSLEVALRAQPHFTLISEEIAWKNRSLHFIVYEIAQLISNRSKAGMPYGVIVIPEGLIQAIPEIHTLLQDLGSLMSKHKTQLHRRNVQRRIKYLSRKLSKHSRLLFHSFPEDIQERLVLQRDAHGNINVSWIATEELLMQLVQQTLQEPIDMMGHFYGYEGRCADPTPFDAKLAYHFGLTAGSLVLGGHTGYMAAGKLDKTFTPYALPLTGLLQRELRNGEHMLVIEKTRITGDDPAFKEFEKYRTAWKTLEGVPVEKIDKPKTVELNS